MNRTEFEEHLRKFDPSADFTITLRSYCFKLRHDPKKLELLIEWFLPYKAAENLLGIDQFSHFNGYGDWVVFIATAAIEGY